MPRLRSPLLVALSAAIAVAGCSPPGGIAGIDPGRVTSTAAPAEPIGDPPAPFEATSTPEPPVAPSTSAAATTTAPTSLRPADDVWCPAGAEPSCGQNTAAASAHLRAGVSGGTYGFHFVRVGGGVLASQNAEHPFYPASSLKVLHHIHAVRWIGAQPDPQAALATPVPVYQDACAGNGSSWTEPLSAVLRAMMVDSDNRRANAVQDYFGREAINATAADVLGAESTVLAHRFGCGGPANDPANRSTALDLSRIYERVARGEVFDAQEARLFGSLMLGPPWPSLDAAVGAAAEALGLDAGAAVAFRRGMALHYKAGWWQTNLSVGGYLTLPRASCDAGPPRTYAFAVFVDRAASVATSFDVGDLVAVVLRDEIRAALAAHHQPDGADCPP